MKSLRLAILGSTKGTNMLRLVAAIQQKKLPASIDVVISNRAEALILERAKEHQLPALFIDPKGLTREEYDHALAERLQAFEIELIVLIGYMRILSPYFIGRWPHQIINVHPSLLPDFAGGMDRHVHQAVLDSGVKESGCTVHFVTEVVDSGPIIVQKKCPVFMNDTVDTLRERVQSLEGDVLIEAIQTIKERL